MASGRILAIGTLVVLAVPWPIDGRPSAAQISSKVLSGPSYAIDDVYEPGHVYRDRRDELRGSRRDVLRGLRPRPTLEPRSRVRPIPSTSLPEVKLRDPAADFAVSGVARGGRLPRGVVVCRTRYRSFHEATGTYRTYDGVVRVCPYLK